MYNLTDYSLSDLRVIQAANEEHMNDLADQIKLTFKYFDGDVCESAIAKIHSKIAVLREHNVHLLTAIQIVKDRETVNSN